MNIERYSSNCCANIFHLICSKMSKVLFHVPNLFITLNILGFSNSLIAFTDINKSETAMELKYYTWRKKHNVP